MNPNNDPITSAIPPMSEPHAGGARLHIATAGGVGLSIAGAPIVLANRKARGILAYLAMEGDGTVSRERLAGLLWSDFGERQARNSLRQAIFEIRDSLRGYGFAGILTGRDPITLDRRRVHLDIDEVLADITAGRAPNCLQHTAWADQLLATYEDLSPLFAEWLAEARRSARDRLLRGLERAFSDPSVVRSSRRWLAEAATRVDPMHEEACRTAMRLAAEDGETGAALRSYAALYEVLGADMDMEPSAETQDLVVRIKRGEIAPLRPAQYPVSPTAAANPGTLASRAVLAPDDAPVVAVLAFRTNGPDRPPDYFADGIVEDIVSLLAALREPVVISANSTRCFREPEFDDPIALAARLGADYFVCGTVSLRNGTARIAVELAEASQGAVLWNRTIEAPGPALFEAQAEIAAGIANAIVPRLNEVELRMSRRRAPEDLGAYHLLLRARDRMFQFDPAPFEEAGPLLSRAAALDPGFAPIYAAMIEWRCYRIFQGWSPDREADAAALEAAAALALRLDPGHARALALYGHNRTIIEHAYEQALDLLERAVAAGPNDAETLIWTCPTLAYVGRAEEAIARARRAIALSPRDPMMFRYEHFLGIAHYAAGDLEAAAEIGMRSAARHPNFTSNLRFTVAALGGLGRTAEAAPLVGRLMELQPTLRVGEDLPRYAFRDQAKRNRHARNLRLAGIPG
jgi:DNA-binding SARP family transcriptional activator